VYEELNPRDEQLLSGLHLVLSSWWNELLGMVTYHSLAWNMCVEEWRVCSVVGCHTHMNSWFGDGVLVLKQSGSRLTTVGFLAGKVASVWGDWRYDGVSVRAFPVKVSGDSSACRRKR
jgi:hypothetical protein